MLPRTIPMATTTTAALDATTTGLDATTTALAVWLTSGRDIIGTIAGIIMRGAITVPGVS